MRLKWFDIHAFNVTALIFLLIAMLSRLPVDFHFLDPLRNRLQDYQITDIFYSQMRESDSIPEERVVLVNTGRPDRERIARMLERILDAAPAVTGVDIVFSGRKEPYGDSLLAAALARGGQDIVLATILPEPRPEDDVFAAPVSSDPMFQQNNRRGFINFPSNKTRTVRYFSPVEQTVEGPVHAFAAELLRHTDPGAFARLEGRGRPLERIHYTATEEQFIRIEGDMLLDSTLDLAPVLRHRIVILGYSGSDDWDAPPLDKHFTPLNPQYVGKSLPDMYGYAIHANVARMILDGWYVRFMPKWLNLLLAFLICYLHVLLPMWIHGRFYAVYYLLSRLLQLLQFVLLFFLVAWLYERWLFEWDFSLGFLALALVVDAQVIYTALLKRYRRDLLKRRRRESHA